MFEQTITLDGSICSISVDNNDMLWILQDSEYQWIKVLQINPGSTLCHVVIRK